MLHTMFTYYRLKTHCHALNLLRSVLDLPIQFMETECPESGLFTGTVNTDGVYGTGKGMGNAVHLSSPICALTNPNFQCHVFQLDTVCKWDTHTHSTTIWNCHTTRLCSTSVYNPTLTQWVSLIIMPFRHCWYNCEWNSSLHCKSVIIDSGLIYTRLYSPFITPFSIEWSSCTSPTKAAFKPMSMKFL